MQKKLTNYAFIDSQNINLGVQELSWKLDWRRFRVHLEETYRVAEAYLFISYMPEYSRMYTALQRYGYVLIFKPVMHGKGGKTKGGDRGNGGVFGWSQYRQCNGLNSEQ